MGMDISAKLMYGLFYEDIVAEMDDDAVELLEAEIYEGDWSTGSPWYDSPMSKWFIGIDLIEYFDYSEVGMFLKSLEDAENKFKNRFGFTGHVFAAKDVT